MNVAGFVAFINTAPADALHYAGKDVRLGTANRPILWLARKKDGRCVVIYADLSVKEVSAKERRNCRSKKAVPRRGQTSLNDRERNNWRIFTPLTLPSPRRGEGAADSYSFRSPNGCANAMFACPIMGGRAASPDRTSSRRRARWWR